jgi:hypothetical protein
MTKEQEQVFLDSFKAIAERDEKMAKQMHERYLVAEKEARELRKQWIEKRLSRRK